MMRDPEVMSALMDPMVLAACQDVMANPANISKYRDNPKFIKLFQKMGFL